MADDAARRISQAKHDDVPVTEPKQIFETPDAFQSAALESRRLDWLEWALNRADVQRLSDAELLQRVVDIDDPNRQNILGEMQRRLESWSVDKQRVFARLLEELACAHDRPGVPAQQVDRQLSRFLHRLAPEAGAALAYGCVRSHRLARRRAAWRHYRRHGVPDNAVPVLAADLSQCGHRELRELAALHADLLAAVNLPRLVESFDEFYWRGRALATGFAFGLDIPEDVISQRPAEVLFGIRRAGRGDVLPLARRIFETSRDKTEVITEAVRLFAEFESLADLDVAMQAGRRHLATTENFFYRELRAWLHGETTAT